jgi:hypothetical protein
VNRKDLHPELTMTVQLIHGPALALSHDAPQRMLAVAFIKSALDRLRDRLRRAADLRAARKRRRLRLQTPHLLDDRIYAELSQARAELEFVYRNNLCFR